MKRQYTYEQIIGKKLNELTPPDVAGLWDNMEAILDREMPLQKEKKRPVAWWVNANLLAAAGIFMAIGSVYTLCHVAGREPSVANTTAAISSQAPASGNPVLGTAQAAWSREAGHLPSSKTVRATTSTGINKTKGWQTSAAGPNVMEENTVAVSSFVAASPAVTETVEETGEELHGVITAPLKEAALVPSTTTLASAQQLPTAKAFAVLAAKKKTVVVSDRGFTVGLAASLPVAIGSQNKVALDRQGKKSQWQDLAPAVYAQLHLNKKFYLQAEFQPASAQYTPGFTLYNRTDVLNPDEKQQKVVKLNKLFYTHIPVSFHYNTPVKNLTVGLGVQYSKLHAMVLQDQEYYHLIGAGGVFTVDEQKNEVVVKNPEAVRSHSSGDVVDSVARAFGREDWRLLADVSYRYKTLQLGVRYTEGVRPYINSNFTNLRVKDRNESLQVYLRVNLFDSRKKAL